MNPIIFDIAKDIYTPLSLGGLTAIILFFLIKQILSKDIFPSLTKVMSSKIINKIIDRLFILALVAMILGFIAFVFQYMPLHVSSPVSSSPTFTEEEKEVVILKREIDRINVHFNDRKRIKKALNVVEEKALKVADDLANNIPDEKLQLAPKIIKYSYSSYAYWMASMVESNEKYKLTHLNKAIAQGEFALKVIEEVKNNPIKYQEIFNWIRKENEAEGIRHVLARSYALKVRLGDKTSVRYVKALLESLPSAYKKSFPPKAYENLKWFLDQPEFR